MAPTKVSVVELNVTADLQKWRAFVAIAELGSITRAALYLDSNQPVLSRQLSALERECGVHLFNRTGRGVELSEIGQHIFPQVKDLLFHAGQLERLIYGGERVPSGRVVLGLLPSISHLLIRPLFDRIRDRFPDIHLRIFEGSSGQVDEWLVDARVDIAILYRYGPSLPDTEHSLAVVDSYLVGTKGDPLTAATEISFSALDSLPFILPSPPNGLRNALDALARRAGVTIAPVIEADSLPLMKSMVADKKFYTVLPLHAVWNEVGQGVLQAAKLVNPSLQRSVSMALAKSKGAGSAACEVAAQIVHIVDEMADTGMWLPGAPV